VKLQKNLSGPKTAKQSPESRRQEWRTKIKTILLPFHKPSNNGKDSAADYEKAIVFDALGRPPNGGVRTGDFPNELALSPLDEEVTRVIE
jgi:hypothetical protein